MDDLASASMDVLRLQNEIELHRSAVVGALADRRRHDVPNDDTDAFIGPVLESFGYLAERVELLAGRLMAAGTRLHRLVPCRQAAK